MFLNRCFPVRVQKSHLQVRGHSGVRVVVRAGKQYQASYYPGPDEEASVSHSAFMSATELAKPKELRIPGLQEFCAAIWERRKSIPSQAYSDPLDHLFTEFDKDNDGRLTSTEIAQAFQSRGVDATPDQIQIFIEAVDADSDHLISRGEWPEFVFSMAIADLHTKSPEHVQAFKNAYGPLVLKQASSETNECRDWES